MKQELRDKWVAALRSGDYEQTRGTLHNEKGYCCMGVLAKIAWGDPKYRPSTMLGFVGFTTSIGAALEKPGLSDAGLQSNNADILMKMNDGKRDITGERETVPARSFIEIADWIEENVPVESSEPSSDPGQ